MTGAITQAIDALENPTGDFIRYSENWNAREKMRTEALEALKAFKDGVPERMEEAMCKVKDLRNASFEDCYKIGEGVQHLQDGIK